MTSSSNAKRSIAVIGSGMSGLTLASRLAGRGLDVTVFEKARGPGGRMSTRREGELEFDHGAQYFTVRDDRFAGAVAAWEKKGIVRRWEGNVVRLTQGTVTPTPRETSRYVAVPRMNSICRHLAVDLSVKLRVRVETVRGSGGVWQLIDDRGQRFGRFDSVVVTTPPEQAAAFLCDAPGVMGRVRAARMAPCWAVMLVFDRSLGVVWDAAFVGVSPLSWVARNGTKPNRPADEAWVLHGSPEWSLEHLDLAPEAVVERLTDALFDAAGVERIDPVFAKAHRWRYARTERPIDDGFVWEPSLGVGVCGDWCRGSRVEDAFLSGFMLADQIAR